MYKLIPLIVTSLALLGCGGGNSQHEPETGHGEHDHSGHAAHGPHGGELLEVGAHVAHLELLHDPASKSVTIHVLSSDLKSPVELASPPILNMRVGDEPVQVVLAGSGSEFTATHDALAGEPEGRIVLELNGKTWQVPMEHVHHDHGEGKDTHHAHPDGGPAGHKHE